MIVHGQCSTAGCTKRELQPSINEVARDFYGNAFEMDTLVECSKK